LESKKSQLSIDKVVPSAGLVVAVVILLGVVPFSGAIAPGYDTILAIASVLFLIAAALIWVKSIVGYGFAILTSLLFLGLFSSDIPHYLTGFADSLSFLAIIVIVPVLISVIASSVLGARRLMMRGSPSGQGKTFSLQSVMAIFVLGFVLSGVFVGSLANGSVLAIGASANTPANITIVSGAYNPGAKLFYSPENLTVTVGTTVTWVNDDPVTHTITSTTVPSGAKSFTSGFLAYQNKFSYTFTVPGVYYYYCTIHPFMTGTVTVTSRGSA
jgi:plastocyanin